MIRKVYMISIFIIYQGSPCGPACGQSWRILLVHLRRMCSLLLLHGSEMKWKLLSCVQLFVTPWTVACLAPLSMGILQARILEWVAMPSSRETSQSRDQTQVSHISGRFFANWAMGKPKNTGVGRLSLLQGVFLTQKLNQGLLLCRWILTNWALG